MITSVKRWAKARATSILIVGSGTLVAMQIIVGSILDLIIGAILVGLIQVALWVGKR